MGYHGNRTKPYILPVNYPTLWSHKKDNTMIYFIYISEKVVLLRRPIELH